MLGGLVVRSIILSVMIGELGYSGIVVIGVTLM
jgi:hypothetical protein